jgi:hypothetical protein
VNLYDGSWHYLAVTYDAATATVDAYVDALGLGAQHVATGSGAFSLSSSPVRVGNWIDTVVNQPFNGGLDEVAVYPSALSAKTILAHYKAAGYLPAIRKLSPDAGSTAGGNTVTITGTGFTQDAKVTFGSTPAASLTFVSSTELKATAPPEAAGVVKVTVTNYVGSSKTTKADLYAYGPPAVTSINPTSGTTAGGTVVTIIGSGFVPAAKVRFGTDAATVKFVSPTTLTATSPAQPAGSVDVTVTTAAGTSTTSPADVFTYN